MLNLQFVRKAMLGVANTMWQSVQVEHSHVNGIGSYGPVPSWSWGATARSLGFRAQMDLHVQVCTCTVKHLCTSVYVYSQTGIVQVCTCTVKQALYKCAHVQSNKHCTSVYCTNTNTHIVHTSRYIYLSILCWLPTNLTPYCMQVITASSARTGL